MTLAGLMALGTGPKLFILLLCACTCLCWKRVAWCRTTRKTLSPRPARDGPSLDDWHEAESDRVEREGRAGEPVPGAIHWPGPTGQPRHAHTQGEAEEGVEPEVDSWPSLPPTARSE